MIQEILTIKGLYTLLLRRGDPFRQVLSHLSDGSKLNIKALRQYVEFASHLRQHHGLAVSVKILKEVHSRCKLVCCGRSPEGITLGGVWIKTSTKGFPLKLNQLEKLALKFPRCALTISNLVVLARLPPAYDVRTITEPSKDTMSQEFLQSFSVFCEKLPKVPVVSKGLEWHTSVKSGPNGPSAIRSSGLDARAIAVSPTADWFLTECTSRVGSTYLIDRYREFIGSIVRQDRLDAVFPKGGLQNAKLAYRSDKAGKTRVVYILNYWFQELLLPRHEAAMGWLKKQPQDGTYDQVRAVLKVKDWTRQGKALFSFDRTAATDRWPRVHQEVAIRALFGPDWGHVWACVRGKTPAYSPPHKEVIRYSVGQPMGAYASWAALAISHHLRIRKLAMDLQVKAEYVVLGDDVVICGKRLAEAYTQALTTLGVTISQGKSIIAHDDRPSAAEFAKQTLLRGENLTPRSPQLYNQVYYEFQWWKFIDLALELCDRYDLSISITQSTLKVPDLRNKLRLRLPSRDQKKLRILLSHPHATWAPGLRPNLDDPSLGTGEVVTYANPWAGVDELLVRYAMQYQIGRRLEDAYEKRTALRDGLLGLQGVPALRGFLVQTPGHPLVTVIDRRGEALLSAAREIADVQLSSKAAHLLMDADYRHQLLVKGVTHRQWQDSKSRRLKMGCTLGLELHRMVTGTDQSWLGSD